VRRAAVAAILAALVLAAPAQAAPDWDANLGRAIAYAETRAGVEAFVLRDDRGVAHGYRGHAVYGSASVLKAMLLAAYLRRPSVRVRALTDRERALLGPMIRRSANDPASYLVSTLGAGPLERLARKAAMGHFRLRSPVWGLSEITAYGQARFFRRLESLLPNRHRAYAMRLLRSIVPSQRWGVPPVKPRGWRIYFKGGWGAGTGLRTHQVALLTRGDRRVSIAILTQDNPSHEYGIATVRGIAKRLLRGLE
jgi:hypothetical protein